MLAGAEEEFPNVRTCSEHGVVFADGSYCKLPACYHELSAQAHLRPFYKSLMRRGEAVAMGVDPLGFNYGKRGERCFVGLIFSERLAKGVAKEASPEDVDMIAFARMYAQQCYPKSFIMQRLESLHRREHFWDSVPASVVVHNVHEIRGLNAQITGLIELMRMGDESLVSTKEREEMMDKLYAATRLIKLLLDDTRLHVPNFMETLPLGKGSSFLIRDALERMASIYTGGPKRNHRYLHISGYSPQRIKGQRAYFEVLINIFIENALRYSIAPERMPPQITYGYDEAQGTVIKIRSYGLLIPQADRMRVFTRGFRSKVHQKQIAGTGIGLYNAYMLAKHYGVRLHYEAQVLSEGLEQSAGWNTFVLSCFTKQTTQTQEEEQPIAEVVHG